MAGVMVGRVYVCRVAGMCDPIWQVTLRNAAAPLAVIPTGIPAGITASGAAS